MIGDMLIGFYVLGVVIAVLVAMYFSIVDDYSINTLGDVWAQTVACLLMGLLWPAIILLLVLLWLGDLEQRNNWFGRYDE